MPQQRLRARVVIEVKSFDFFVLKGPLIALHCRAMQPKFLLVEFGSVMRVTEKEAVLDENDAARVFF